MTPAPRNYEEARALLDASMAEIPPYHRNPDPALERTERLLVAGWRRALFAAPRPLENPSAIGRAMAYHDRGREVEALIVGAVRYEPRLGAR